LPRILAAALTPEGFPVTEFEDGDSFLRAASTRVTGLAVALALDIEDGVDALGRSERQRRWFHCRRAPEKRGR
jgi:DNA-binding response OmpR family regulator